MVFHPGKLVAISRLSFLRGLAVVCVGFPATPLTGFRVRLCVSAGHTRQDLDFALEVQPLLPQLRLPSASICLPEESVSLLDPQSCTPATCS